MLSFERRKIEMLPILAIANLVLLLVVLLVLLLRKPSPPASAEDPRLAQLLAADLPTQIARADERGRLLDEHLRREISQLRTDTAAADGALRTEVLDNISKLGDTLRNGLDNFRGDNSKASETLRIAMETQIAMLSQRFAAFTTDTMQYQADSRDLLHNRLTDLGTSQTTHQEKLRATVEERLTQLNQANTAKLEEMRQTVDEKLHATLQTRLTESFGAVTDQLTKVHTGLGEMTKLSAGVDDLSRIFTNVKSRGTVGEVMLETLLKQMLAANQYVKNAKVKSNSQEMVEFAVKLPTPSGEALLPIDSKFPREAWERLESAYQTGADIQSAGKAFETAIRNEGKKICEKYIAPPNTTAFAIMFLPTEG